jgi:hypothetical protein
VTPEALDDEFLWLPPTAVVESARNGGRGCIIFYRASEPPPVWVGCRWSTQTANQAIGTGVLVGTRWSRFWFEYCVLPARPAVRGVLIGLGAL